MLFRSIPGTADSASFTANVSGSPKLPAINPNNVVGPAVLMLRPDNVRVHAAGESAFLSGTVVETHFYGGSSVTAIAVEGFSDPVSARNPGAPSHAVGDVVGLSWLDSEAIVIAETPA